MRGFVIRVTAGDIFADKAGDWGADPAVRFDAAMKHPERKPWDTLHAIHVYFLTQSGEMGYCEVRSPLELVLEFDAGTNVSERLRKAETDLRLDRCALLHSACCSEEAYAVGYDGKLHNVCRVELDNRFRHRMVAQHFKEQSGVQVHEEWLNQVERFNHRTGVRSLCWVDFELEPFKFTRRTDCDINGRAVSLTVVEDPPPDPVLPVLAWDIETVVGSKDQWRVMRETEGGRSVFPDARRPTNAVVQISACYVDGRGDERNLLFEWNADWIARHGDDRVVRRYRGQEYELRVYHTELETIMAFLDFRRELRAPLELTYNGSHFDWPYLIARVHSQSPRPSTRTLVLGRDPLDCWSSYWDAAHEKRRSVVEAAKERRKLTPEASGVVIVDVCEVFKSGKFGALRSYKLKSVTEKFLGPDAAKEPLTHLDIFDAYYGCMSRSRYNAIAEETGREKAELPPSADDQLWLVRDYCLTDAKVLISLWRLKLERDIFEMCRFSGVELQRVVNRKSKEMVSTMFHREASRRGCVINRRKRIDDAAAAADGPRYEGAIVLPVKEGLYAGARDCAEPAAEQPPIPACFDTRGISARLLRRTSERVYIPTLDFASLYPSIMELLNLCPSALVIANGQLYGCEAACDRPKLPVVEEAVMRKLPPGHWKSAPLADKYNCVVVPSAKAGELPMLFFFEKSKQSIFYSMIDTVLTERRRHKKIMKALQGLAADLKGHGAAAKALSDTRVVSDAVAQLVDAKAKVDATELVGKLGLPAADVQHAAAEEAKLSDARQLVRKVVCNAMYGSCGFDDTKGDKQRLPAPISSIEVAACTTAHGRQMIYRVKRCLESMGYETVAGDTDSVISRFEARDLAHAWELAEKAAKHITDHEFGDGITLLEPDGVSFNVYLHGKKMRVGLISEDPTRLDKVKIELKGLATKREGEPFVKRGAVQAFVDVVLQLGDLPITGLRMVLLRQLVGHCERFLRAPEKGGFAVADYVYSTEINKLDGFKGPLPAHMKVVKEEQRLTGATFSLKDRVEYVVLRTSNPRDKVADRVMSAKRATWSKIDRLHYFQKVMWPYVCSILERPWWRDDTQILPLRVRTAMYEMYSSLLSKQSSKLAKSFASIDNRAPKTDVDRIGKLDRLLAEPIPAPSRPQAKRSASGKPLSAFFKKLRK